MKTYHFATPTPSYGVVHTTVTCNHPRYAKHILGEDKLRNNPAIVGNYSTDEIVATLTWELFTVTPVAGGGREAILQARELRSLSKENAVRALKEMKIQQDIILAEQHALDAAFAAKRAAFVMKIGNANPRTLHPENPLFNEYQSIESTYDNAKLDGIERSLLENQRELTKLALENQHQIIISTAV